MKGSILGSYKEGSAIIVGDREIRPVAKSLVLRAPGGWGGLVYNRPVAVLVRSEGGREQRLAIEDFTRWYQLLILAGASAFLLSAWLLTRLLRR